MVIIRIKNNIQTAINTINKVIHVSKIQIGLQETEVITKIKEIEVITEIAHAAEVITATDQEREIRMMTDQEYRDNDSNLYDKDNK